MTASTRSLELMKRSQKVIPGGVNSPVRAFGPVGGSPPFIQRGEGCRVWDEDGKEYIDFVLSWGPLILGHAHAEVLEAAARTAARGTSFGAATALEVEFAEQLQATLPWMEQLRLVSSGTEACMSALRLARGVTGRDRIVKFDGCYHGHGDSLLVAAGSGVATLGIPGSPGVPSDLARHTTVLPYNNSQALRDLFAADGGSIACVIVEPVAGNMGCVPPEPGFLETIQELCREHGALFVVDEVMSGFRAGPKGAVGLYKLDPDLVCLGKVVGGGFPLAAFGGKARWMQQLAPVGPVYQAGTLSGNPVAVAAGAKTLEVLGRPGQWDILEARAAQWFGGLEARCEAAGVPASVQRVGTMGCVYFSEEPVRNMDDARTANAAFFVRFFQGLMERGVYIAPSPFEAGFLSLAHSEADIEQALEAVSDSLQAALP